MGKHLLIIGLVCIGSIANAETFGPGKHFIRVGSEVLELVVTSNGAELNPIKLVTLTGSPTSPDPKPPAPSSFSQDVQRQADQVTGDPNRERTAADLAAVYYAVSLAVDRYAYGSESEIAAALKDGTNRVLSEGQAAAWSDFRDWLGREIGSLTSDRLEHVAIGLRSASSSSAAAGIDREFISLIFDIIIGKKFDFVTIFKLVEQVLSFFR